MTNKQWTVSHVDHKASQSYGDSLEGDTSNALHDLEENGYSSSSSEEAQEVFFSTITGGAASQGSHNVFHLSASKSMTKSEDDVESVGSGCIGIEILSELMTSEEAYIEWRHENDLEQEWEGRDVGSVSEATTDETEQSDSADDKHIPTIDVSAIPDVFHVSATYRQGQNAAFFREVACYVKRGMSCVRTQAHKRER